MRATKKPRRRMRRLGTRKKNHRRKAPPKNPKKFLSRTCRCAMPSKMDWMPWALNWPHPSSLWPFPQALKGRTSLALPRRERARQRLSCCRPCTTSMSPVVETTSSVSSLHLPENWPCKSTKPVKGSVTSLALQVWPYTGEAAAAILTVRKRH